MLAMPAGGSAACKIPVLEPSIARGCPALHSCLRACSSGNAEASDAAAELAARLRAAEQDVGEAEVMAAEAVGMAERAQVGGCQALHVCQAPAARLHLQRAGLRNVLLVCSMNLCITLQMPQPQACPQHCQLATSPAPRTT